jgi:anti-sigma factor RsiW
MKTPPISEGDLHAFLDGELDEARRAEVASYLVEHPEPAERLEIYRRQGDELRGALAPIAEEPIPPRLDLTRIIASRNTLMKMGSLYGLAASVLLVASGAVGGWLLRGIRIENRAPSGIVALTEEAADSYNVFAPDRVRPVEVREQPEMVKWASKRMNRAVAAPDLTGEGYRFMGGRLVSTPHGPAVLFMYDDDRNTRIVFLSRPMLVEKEARLMQHNQGSVAAVAWADGGIGYSLVGPVSAKLLERIAGEVRRQLTGTA